MSNGYFCILGLGLMVFSSGCAGAPPPAEAPPAAARAKPSEASIAAAAPVAAAATVAAAQTTPEVVTTREVPVKCDDTKSCYPPPAFTEAVCKKKFPDLPLVVFAGRMPWQHLYVKAEYVEPVNPHGGEQSEAWMKFGEEVVVLRKRSPSAGKGIQMSGPSDVDVLRWDGTCATIREEMLVSYVTAPMQSPRIIWKYLNGELQEALLKNQVVARARDGEKKGCRDSSLTHPTPVCEKAMQKLTDAIALAVHQNVELPSAGNFPEWKPQR
jgi:hypothetical protein